MSATPRPWRVGIWTDQRDPGDGVDWDDVGGQVVGSEGEHVATFHATEWELVGPDGVDIQLANRDLTLRAVNAFEALLAVAKAADLMKNDVWHDDYGVLLACLQHLDAQHPGWREW